MKLVVNFFLYSGTEILNKAIPFLLLPIITKYLTPEEYGLYGMYQVVLSFLVPLITMNSQINITRNFFKVSTEEIGKIISSLLLILHMHFFIALIVIYIVTIFFHNPFGIPINILYIMPIIIYAQTINTFNLTVLRNQERVLHYGGLQILITIINYTIVLFLLLSLKEGWFSLVYGAMLSHFIVSIYSLYALKKNFSLKWKFYSLKDIYIISLPLIFHILGGSIIAMSDRIFIEHMLDINKVGLYMIGNQFGMIAAIAINTIMLTLNPWIYKNLADKNYNMVRKAYFLMFGFLILGLFLWWCSLRIFPYMIDEKFNLAQDVIFWVIMTFVIRGWYQIFFNVIVHEGKTKLFMYITGAGGVINLILNYFFIDMNGIIGAAQATLVAYFIIFILTFYYANKYSELKWNRF